MDRTYSKNAIVKSNVLHRRYCFQCRIPNLKKHIWGDCIYNYKHGAHFLSRFFLEFCSSDLHRSHFIGGKERSFPFQQYLEIQFGFSCQNCLICFVSYARAVSSLQYLESSRIQNLCVLHSHLYNCF